jgi:hypothetical protein
MIVNPSLRRRSYRKLAKRLRDFAACLASGSEGERSCSLAAEYLEAEANEIDTAPKQAPSELLINDLRLALKILLQQARVRNGGKLPDSPDYHFAADVVARAEGRPGRAS